MPIHEIRESIESPSITTDSNGFAIIQKEINLKENMSHKMLQCDIFIDNPNPTFSGDAYTMEILVTPTPVIYTDMVVNGWPSRAPSASVDNVLFKQIITRKVAYDEVGENVVTEFPNRFISARPTFTWYMPKLYLTLFIHSGTDPNVDFRDIAITMYCAVEAKKVSLVTYGMGVIRENHIAQVAQIMANGRSIPPSRNVGQSFPMWRYGGVRPELMISGSSLANFFNRSAPNEEQNTLTTTELRVLAQGARQMQPNITAFGTDFPLPVGAIPSWVRLELFKGVEAGAVRDQWPPTKYADNGNTLTF